MPEESNGHVSARGSTRVTSCPTIGIMKTSTIAPSDNRFQSACSAVTQLHLKKLGDEYRSPEQHHPQHEHHDHHGAEVALPQELQVEDRVLVFPLVDNEPDKGDGRGHTEKYNSAR